MSSESASFARFVRQVFTKTLALILSAAGILLLFGQKPWAKGVVLGGAASMVSLLMMARGIPNQAAEPGARSARRAAGRYSLGMMVMAAALVYAGMTEGIALGAAIPALFSARAVLLTEELLDRT